VESRQKESFIIYHFSFDHLVGHYHRAGSEWVLRVIEARSHEVDDM
jgi:hypothetical protein